MQKSYQANAQRNSNMDRQQHDRKEARTGNRVARPTMQNMAGRGSHTTVRTGLVYSGSLNIGLTFS